MASVIALISSLTALAGIVVTILKLAQHLSDHHHGRLSAPQAPAVAQQP